MIFKKIIFSFTLLSISIVNISSIYGSSQFKPDYFDGKITLSNPANLDQISIITLDLMAIIGNCGRTIIKFRTPDGITTIGQTTFEEEAFTKGSSRMYSVSIKVLEKGTYALQASVYYSLPDGRNDVEHFFKFLIVDDDGFRVTDKVDSLNRSNIETKAIILPAPSDVFSYPKTFSINGYVTYYDDNISKPLPIRWITVNLYDLKGNTYNLLETQKTDNNGYYAFDNIDNAPDKVFRIKVSFINNVLRIVDKYINPYEFDLPVISNVFVDSVNGDCFFNEKNQHRCLGHIFNTIMDAHDFLMENVNWSRKIINVQYPYESDKSLSKYSYSHIYPLRDQILNEIIYIASNRPWYRISMLHEYGHAVMMAMYDYNYRNYPKSQYIGDPDSDYTHSVFTVSDEAFAIKEGWAEFFESLIDDNAFNTTQYSNAKTSNIEYNSWWKGFDSKNNKGEIVEGAVASILWDIADTTKSNDETPNVDDDMIDGGFKELWNIMIKYKPINVRKIWDAWIELDYNQITSLYSIFINNGVKISIPYDMNNDGKINVEDMAIIGSYLGHNVTDSIQPTPDINKDGKVDILDILIIAKKISQ
jgi:hypothetical protein